MDSIIDPTLCNGCHTCYMVCPKECINMIENNEGFLEPLIDKDRCIDCKICINKCPVNNTTKIEKESNLVSIAAINKNDSVRELSSSGGVFVEIANYILARGGSVYGVAFNENFKVHHIRIHNKNEIYKLQGSKYVQSKIGTIFLDVKKDLEKGKKVLFTGTPCQVEGLLSFLGKKYDNLYTQDIICHGVPSPKAWQKYIKEFNGSIKNISFRDKSYGWNKFSMKIETSNNKYINTLDKDIFLQSFLNNLNLRKSCYNCSFKKVDRNSDITLADFWGIANIDKEYFDDKGTSLVILQSDKGRFLYEQVKGNFVSTEINLDDAIKYNISINQSVELTNRRNRFFKNIDKYDYNELVTKSMRVSNLDKILNLARRIKYKITSRLK